MDMRGNLKLKSAEENFEGQLPGSNGPVSGKGHVEIYVTFSVEPYDAKQPVWTSQCGNACQGEPKHANHAACDGACDIKCQAQHFYMGDDTSYLWGYDVEGVTQPLSEMLSKAVRSMSESGANISAPVAGLIDKSRDFIEKFNEKGEKTRFSYAFDHIKDPCTMGIFTVWSQKVAAFASVRTVYIVSQGDKEVYRGDVGTPQKLRYSAASYFALETSTSTNLACLCEPKPTTEDKPTQTSMSVDGVTRPFALAGPNLNFALAAPLMHYGDSELQIKGQNVMNCSASMLGTVPSTAFLPAGTLLIPDNPLVQTMTVAHDTMVSALAQSPLGGPKQVDVLCTEMTKNMPNGSVNFAVAANADGAITRLAKLSGKGFGRGIIDQVRMWAYTDAASYDEMAKKLLPMVPVDEYLTAVDQVLQGSCPDEKRAKLMKEFTLERCADGKLSQTAFRRTVLAERKKGTPNLGPTLVAMAEGWAKGGPVAPGLYAEVCNYLGSLGTVEGIDGCHKVLSAVPAGFRLRVAQAGGLEPLAEQVFSGDKAAVSKAVEILAMYKSPKYVDSLAVGQARLAKWK